MYPCPINGATEYRFRPGRQDRDGKWSGEWSCPSRPHSISVFPPGALALKLDPLRTAGETTTIEGA
ncbi:hypothetical protein V0288_23480 [Pannus brasiliensis CCIBt3594]|uniref:Uncharacterized protein n=1 Tax=Pannus brasiliensis CCIBt3594 TaxID=1427578 RepID=A0AAW9QY30_9CHRO